MACTSSSSLSYSSTISPTISSSTSSIVAMPARAPYSSTTTARCTCSACSSRSNPSTLASSGTT